VQEISVTYSFPAYLIKNWVSIFGKDDTIALCTYFNSTPKLTLRIEADKISYKNSVNISTKRMFSSVEVNILIT